ncbi:MAG TPA: HPF/RaiA family ribosome-associated protein [Myxococcota bacterium]|nr:HPF/RaiA family ribosome-associated protein [Myxococcota bacterium]
MQIPATITFHNVDPSLALKTRIDEKIAKLDARYPNVMGCHVIVESAHHHQNKGRLYTVRIHVTLPGGAVMVSHHPGKNPRKHDKVYAAMNSAFSAIGRQLARIMQFQRADIKSHKTHLETGVVSNYFPEEGYGFVATADGSEVYFHQHAVHNDRFFDLDIGTKVQFYVIPGEGRKGPQAPMVRIAR